MTDTTLLNGAVDTYSTAPGPDQPMWIGGQKVHSTTGEWREVANPAHRGSVICRVPAAGVEDVDRAVAAARAAFPDWRARHFTERARALARIADEITEAKKAFGTVHIALGDSANEYGGLVECDVHLDGMVMEPTIEFDGVVIVVGGRHVYDLPA